MTYFPSFSMKMADSPSIDAFDRLRVSNPHTIFNSKQLWDKAPRLFDEATTGSGTTSAFTANNSCVNMAVSATTAGSITRQSFNHFNYQPGKSQLVFLSVNMRGAVANVEKQAGIFNDKNGIFFEVSDTAYACMRTYTSGSAVDTKVAQASWNKDTMDGNGPSGITIDWSKVQILVIDFEWLGVGRVRYGLVIDGIIYYVHTESAANNDTVVYMGTPNLPIRYNIENDGSGAATSMDHICCTIITEGGVDPTGYLESIATPAAGLSHTTGHTDCIFAIRLKSTHLDAIIRILGYSTFGSSKDDVFLTQLYRNPTIAGGVAWDTTTYAEVDVLSGTPGTSTVTGGVLLDTLVEYSRTTSNFVVPESGMGLGASIAGTSDVIALCITVGTATTVTSALNWEILK